MAVKLELSTKGIVLIVVAVAIVEGLILNPIRFHQTARVDGYSMQVPVLWKPVKHPREGIIAGFQREWVVFESDGVALGDRSGPDSRNAPWTMESAQREQATVLEFQGRNPDFSDPQLFDLHDGKFTSICEEAKVKGYQALVCYVVGTPLQFSYLGSKTYEAAARKMLASLN
jgi:hypothetical protein